MGDAIQQAARLIRSADKVVALTGAGVSTESGIPDFRSQDGLWSRFDPMEYGTLGAFRRDPKKVWGMLAELLSLLNAKPNAGHRAMAKLEEMGLLSGIITQNIDSLHQQAGSTNVVEYHGSMASFSCLQCDVSSPLSDVIQQDIPPRCSVCKTLLKPDIVFFDEQIPAVALHQTEELVHQADLLLVAGTSCQVVPAAYIPQQVFAQGGKIVEINKEPVLQAQAHVILEGSFSDRMSQLVKELV